MNRLAREASPYLRQHADNPVDWRPWGDEAFAAARTSARPIFLSIGYATCHWCHVMAHESFADPAIAALLNADFIPVKVDREERPDVDRVHMAFVQATTGSGGWPMSVFLTPDLRPFYGGTYFPPRAQWGRPSFADVLRELARAWREERDRVERSAAHIVERLATMTRRGEAGAVPGPEALDTAVHTWSMAFDARRGGFGDAPKFPRPAELLFLLREHARTGAAVPRDMALFTLRAMALGGLRDHVGGGFHRYSVDGDWRVPHFEKMLYDQAQLVLAYVEAAQVTGDPFFAQIAEDTLQYVERDLTDPAGGFYSAEDADSVPPGDAGDSGGHAKEGAFYTWALDEVQALLGDDAAAWEARFGLLDGGNAPADPHGEFGRGNLLYTAMSIAQVAEKTGRPPEQVAESLVRGRQRLFLARQQRPRPQLDDKVITAWNGLMIGAAARAARLLRGGTALGQDMAGEDPGLRHLRSAQRAARFVREHLWDAEAGLVRRRWRAGEAGIDGYAEDYACLAWGLVELFQADGDPAWLAWARRLLATLDAAFADPANGGWFSTTGQDASILLRMSEDYDGAEPSASSAAALALMMFARIAGDSDPLQRAERALAAFAGRLTEQPRTVPLMLAVLSTWHATPAEIVVAGSDDEARTDALLDTAARRYLPFAVTVPVRAGYRVQLVEALPWLAPMIARDGDAAAYVCRGFTCELPVTTPAALAARLAAFTPGGAGAIESRDR